MKSRTMARLTYELKHELRGAICSMVVVVAVRTVMTRSIGLVTLLKSIVV